MLGERDLAEEKQSRVRAQRGNDISNRYSYGYVVGGWVSAQRGCDGTLPGARPYPKSVDQGRQHYAFHLLCLLLYCLATSVFGRLQHQNTALW